MKKNLLVIIALVAVLALAACGEKATSTPDPTATTAPTSTTAPTTAPTDAPSADIFAKGEGVMTYAQYDAAAKDDAIVIECFVQATQSWWKDANTGAEQISVYAADKDGAYFIYNMACSEADAKKLVPGTKIKVTGFKAEWSGEIEVAAGATFEIEEGSYIAPVADVTSLIGTADLVKKQNQYVGMKGLKVVASKDANGNEVAWLYKWNGAGSEGDDLYFNVEIAGKVYAFTVESTLCGADSEVYKAVKALKVNDIIDLEGFLYWYNDPQPHVTKVTVTGQAADIFAKGEGVMTYEQYAAAAKDDAVVIECFVQATQSWWKDANTGAEQISVYAADKDGAYFIYNMACSEADAKKLVPGTKIKVTGFKAEWSGEIEVAAGATFEIEDGSYIADAKDVTALFGTDDLVKKQNQAVIVKGLKVVASKDADGNDVAWLYKYNGSGKEGDDLYFNVEIAGQVYAFTVESYLCGADTEVYKAVKELKIGDVIDLEGFLYWYNGPQPHTTAIKVVPAVDLTTEAGILAAAANLAPGEALEGTLTLTGKVTEIVTAYSEQYGNITVNMDVNGTKIQCYRLTGGAELAVDDVITVTGTIKNYNGTVEFDAKATYTK